MRRFAGCFAALALCSGLMIARPASAGIELVANGGFESTDANGDFLQWQQANMQYSNVSVGPTSYAGETMNPDTGSNFALLGSPTNDSSQGGGAGGGGELYQAIATSPGQEYTFSFAYYMQPLDGGQNYFTASFGSTTVLNTVNNNSFTTDVSNNIIWAQESFTVTATSSSTVISFWSGADVNYNTLDSVSVQAIPNPTPEPSSLAVWGLGVVAALVVARRRRSA